ncbi:class I SAM-dependent methyltransferase [Acidomonas methanolica]|uniref:class I SAM-dependent methyltransferase n=1 Tax=Acidomonas methanolica TaxID=437 RepID=UPI00211A878B|nr:class I SAM-dependent methyltransferase [Acidomonas methanolica]MCQ9154670.1 class I SAM-dependent methyltransferase [Acidomonas methanolica]
MRKLFPYGLDAPPVVAGFGAISGLCLLVWLLDAARLLPIRVTGAEWPALGFACPCLGMIWDSARGKLRERERLLDRLTWRGNEHVLDVGSGAGLLAIGAARRVPQGQVEAIDIWQRKDLSGNSADTLLANAAAEGVASRIRVVTADMRDMPFPAAHFEKIVSRFAVHNINGAEERARAIREMARVTAAGGDILIRDILYLDAYAAVLRQAGFRVKITRSLTDSLWRLGSFGALNPGLLEAARPAP